MASGTATYGITPEWEAAGRKIHGQKYRRRVRASRIVVAGIAVPLLLGSGQAEDEIGLQLGTTRIIVHLRKLDSKEEISRLIAEVGEPWRQRVEAGADVREMLLARCGHVSPQFEAVVADANKTVGFPKTTTAGLVEIPACVRIKDRPLIRMPPGGQIGNTLLSCTGYQGRTTRDAVNSLNPKIDINKPVKAGTLVRVPYCSEPFSIRLRPEFENKATEIVAKLQAMGAEASIPGDFDFVREVKPSDTGDDCSASSAFVGFDAAEAIATVKANRKRDDRWGGVSALIVVADTGLEAPDTGFPPFRDLLGNPRQPIDPSGEFGRDPIGINAATHRGPPTLFPLYERRGHGTEVAGLALGGEAGWEALRSSHLPLGLSMVNVVEREPSEQNHSDTYRLEPMGLLTALNFARQRGAQVVNFSVETNAPIEQFAEATRASGALIVVSAGNSWHNIDREPSWPAFYSRDLSKMLLTVAAHNRDKYLPGFSNFGPQSVDIAAPGVCVPTEGLKGQGVLDSGTSMAAPIVSFTAALLALEGIQSPNLMKQRIIAAMDYDPELLWNVREHGRLNVQKAVTILDDLVELDSGKLVAGKIVNPKSVEQCEDGENGEWDQIKKIVPLHATEDGNTASRVWFSRVDGYLDAEECVVKGTSVSLIVSGSSVEHSLSAVKDIVPAYRRVD